jgi:hypothetical protein
MTCVMCNLWKKTFTLVPLAPLIVFSSVHKFFKKITKLNIKVYNEKINTRKTFKSNFE